MSIKGTSVQEAKSSVSRHGIELLVLECGHFPRRPQSIPHPSGFLLHPLRSRGRVHYTPHPTHVLPSDLDTLTDASSTRVNISRSYFVIYLP